MELTQAVQRLSLFLDMLFYVFTAFQINLTFHSERLSANISVFISVNLSLQNPCA